MHILASYFCSFYIWAYAYPCILLLFFVYLGEWIETCGFEFEGFEGRGILGILRQTVDSSRGKAFVAHICDDDDFN